MFSYIFYIIVLFAIDWPNFCIESSKTLVYCIPYPRNNLSTLPGLLAVH